MLYLNLHIGDWMSGTMLCSALERGVYIDLLVAYYSKGRPLMRSECDRIARAYTPDEREAMRYVLEQFFTEDGDEYRNARADKEIAKCKNTSEVNRANARKRWDKERQGAAEDSESDRTSEKDATAYASAYPDADANAMLTRNPKPETENSSVGADKPRRPRKSVSIACPEDVDPVDWDAWMAIRKDKNLKSSTEGFLRAARREASKCNISLQQAIEFCIPRGWAGFTEVYYKKAIAEGATPPERRSTPEKDHEYDLTVALASGFPAKYAEAGIEKRYTGIEADAAALDAVRATLNEEPA
jgi:uncharacterized protein YdaU (DUF1376 family)